MAYSDVIYKDWDDFGECYTVYEDGQCVGSFLDDDVELATYRERHFVELPGIDNRTNKPIGGYEI